MLRQWTLCKTSSWARLPQIHEKVLNAPTISLALKILLRASTGLQISALDSSVFYSCDCRQPGCPPYLRKKGHLFSILHFSMSSKAHSSPWLFYSTKGIIPVRNQAWDYPLISGILWAMSSCYGTFPSMPCPSDYCFPGVKWTFADWRYIWNLH